jgi:hypothetical protein
MGKIMEPSTLHLLKELVRDPSNGWSIGSFGAIGEFVRDADEQTVFEESDGGIEVSTPRGAMRISPTGPLQPIAWDSLSSDGESWSHVLSFCTARPLTASRAVRRLGSDRESVRDKDRDAILFDLGVGSGAVRMCLRTNSPSLIAAMDAAEGQSLFSIPSLIGGVLRAQPHRVLLSPAGRIEVFQPIPCADGKSPEGPHTHLLPKLIAKDRSHSANVPIPEELQSALSMHPHSAWRPLAEGKHVYDAKIDAAFAPILARYGLGEDVAVEEAILAALDSNEAPKAVQWPDTRRGRAKARIVLRRRAAAGDERVAPWRVLHDRAPVEIEEGEEA